MSDPDSTARVALVTGGGRGIGREICLGLARAGQKVAVADLRVPEATETATTINAEGGTAIAVEMDVADGDAVTAGLMSATDQLGPVEVLVNCAGWDVLTPFVATDEDFWDRVIEINYKGPLRTTHGCLPAMIEAGFGRIVNIGSDAGRVGSSGEAVYAGAKGGVIAFTKTIAREVARRGITANVVCPGPTDTPLLEEIASATDTSDKIIGAMARAVPMKRIGQPHEIAAAVVFLCSEEAGYITGQTLSVSGGLTMA
ncbi:MAG: SDR family oxidoreductase [Acidimicrobiaceae bacterium]|nr:SDR family oxidoreductase [Acidimicrobiaceae bacterium]